MIRLLLILPLLLKVLCVVHCYKNQRPQWWIWVIVLVPLGSVAYLFMELIPSMRLNEKAKTVSENIAEKIEPTNKIDVMEERVKLSDSFNNRMELADQYLKGGIYHKAAENLEMLAKGLYEDDNEVLSKLAHSYYLDGQFEKSVEAFQKIKKFHRKIEPTPLALEYVDALLEISDMPKAEEELIYIVKSSNNIEATFKLAMYYKETGNSEKARLYFNQLITDSKFGNQHSYKANKTWIDEAQIELDQLSKA